jgi:hypothetical protein
MASHPLPTPDRPQPRFAEPKRNPSVLDLLVTPIVLTAYVFAAWRLGADLGWFGEFFITDGLLSRWQVWLAFAGMAQFASRRLGIPNRYDHSATT